MKFLEQVVEREGFPEMSALASLDPDGEISRCTTPGKVEAALLRAPTLYCGLQGFCEESTSQWSHCRFWLRETEHYLWFCSLLQIPGNSVGKGQQVQSRLIRLVGLIQEYLGSRWRPHALLLETEAPPSMLFAEIMESPRLFANAAYSAVPIPKTLLVTAGSLYRYDTPDPGRPSAEQRKPGWSCLRSLQAILPEYVVGTTLSIDVVAEIAGVSSRTLQRALTQEGMTYRQLVDLARFHVARERLADPTTSIEEIGRLLGYSESTHFTRSFRRIAGRTPSEYRKELSVRA
jgi:AraC-like DNA-binding protein